jgi:hypothetical protein
MKHVLRIGLFLTCISFALHVVWERAHIGLYVGYEALEGMLPVYVYASLGDAMYTLLAVSAAALVSGRRMLAPRLRGYVLYALLGLSIAIFVEAKAQYLSRWHYTDAMPLIYGFGLSPLLQMTVLLPLSVYIVVRIERWFNASV